MYNSEIIKSQQFKILLKYFKNMKGGMREVLFFIRKPQKESKK